MIAKAILDMFSLSPATTRSAVQSTGQPFQAFSDSLLAASKSFLQVSSTSDGGSKTGRRQRSASDDAAMPSVAVAGTSLDGSAVVTPVASQQTQGTNANVAVLETSAGGSTATDGTSTGVAGLFAQSLTAVEFAGTGSSIAKSGSISTGIALPTGIQSRFSLAQMFLGKTAIVQTTSMGSAAPSTSGVQAVGLAESQTSDAQMSVAQTSAAQASYAPVEIYQAADVQSKLIPVQVPAADAATAQNVTNSVASQPTWNATSTELPENQTSFAPAIAAQVSDALTGIYQIVDVQSNFTSVQTSLAGSAITQNVSTSYVSQPAWNATATKIPETQTRIAPAIVAQVSDSLAGISQTDIIETVDVQSDFVRLQMPVAAVATTQKTLNTIVSQPMWNETVAEIPETQTNVAPAIATPVSIAQPSTAQTSITPSAIQQAAAAQSEITSTLPQAPARPAIAQIIVAGEAIRPVRNVSTTEPVVTKSSIPHAEVSQTNVSRKTTIELASVQSSVTEPSKDLPKSSSKLPVAPMEEMKAPIAVSTKIGNADQSTAASAFPEAVVSQDNGGMQDSLPAAALNALSNAVQNAAVSDPIEPSQNPVLRAALVASAKDIVAPALKADSTVQADPQPAVFDQSQAEKTMSVPGGVVDQLAVSPLSAGPFGVNQIGASSRKPVVATKPEAVDSTNDKDSVTEQTRLKKDAEPPTEKEAKSSSQDAASSGDQSQGGNAARAQATTPVAVNFTVHPAAVIAAAQNAATILPNHTSSTAADATGVGVKMADNSAVHASAALPQAVPVINTAKLIQSMGQSEMRVGMRSNEFGNISISTSTTHDQVSAQISLEHGELAKTLAVHLPELQSRLGGSQPMDVRIDMNGAATGQGTGTFGGTSHGTQDQSHGGRQQAGNMVASTSSIGAAEKQFSQVAVVMPTGYARLDIRV